MDESADIFYDGLEASREHNRRMSVKPEPTDSAWRFVEQVGGYFVWVRDGVHRPYYNTTSDNTPPTKETGGYYDKGALLRLKGIG